MAEDQEKNEQNAEQGNSEQQNVDQEQNVGEQSNGEEQSTNTGEQPTDEEQSSGGGKGDVAEAQFGPLRETDGGGEQAEGDNRRNLEMIYDIPVTVQAELGRTEITVRDLVNLTPGAVVELQRAAGESVDLLVNGVLIGKGDVVVVNENYGLRITEIVSMEDRLREISG